MKVDASSLTNDPRILEFIATLQNENMSKEEQLQKQINDNHRYQDESRKYLDEKKELNELIVQLKDRIKFLEVYRFARSSEKRIATDTMQLRLFNEAEETVRKADENKKSVIVAEHARKPGGKKPIGDNIRRIRIVKDVPESERRLPDGTLLKPIREERHETIFSSPRILVAIEHIRPVYAIPADAENESRLVTAPVEPQMIPKSMASSGFLADIITSKFQDAIPFYRQEKIFKRFGFAIPRITMCRWVMQIHERVRVLEDMMKEDILRGYLIAMDETHVQVMGEKGRANTTKSYMIVSRGGPPGKPVLCYQYNPNRNSEVMSDFLKDYGGVLFSDGLSVYDTVTKKLGLRHAGCWVHSRRNFTDILKVDKTVESALQAVKYIGLLYHIEKEAREQNKNLTPDTLKAIRQEKSVPVLKEFKAWLDNKSIQVPPKSDLGKAVLYCLGQWKKLTLFVDDGNIPLDNNPVENAIRPFVVGRKNWNLVGSPTGAEASAFLYSLIETAKANGHEPYWYIFYLFDKFPLAGGKQDYRALLPYNVTKEVMDKHFADHPILTRLNSSYPE